MSIKLPNLPKPKAIIFDWDDTITNNWWRVFWSMNKTLQHMGYDKWSEEEALRRLGASGRDVFPRIFGNNWQKGSDTYYKFLDETLKDAPEPIDGAVEAINILADKTDIQLAVLSNKRGDLLRDEVKKLGLNSRFFAVIGAGDCERDKPSLVALQKILKHGGLQAGAAIWFAGDSHTDMECAHSGGCTAVMIETKKPPEDMLSGIEPHANFINCLDMARFILNEFYEEIGLIISKTQCR